MSLLPAGPVVCLVLSGADCVSAGTRRRMNSAYLPCCTGRDVHMPLLVGWQDLSPGPVEAGSPHASAGQGSLGYLSRDLQGVSPPRCLPPASPPVCSALRVCSLQCFPLTAASQTSPCSLPSHAAGARRFLSIVSPQNVEILTPASPSVGRGWVQ